MVKFIITILAEFERIISDFLKKIYFNIKNIEIALDEGTFVPYIISHSRNRFNYYKKLYQKINLKIKYYRISLYNLLLIFGFILVFYSPTLLHFLNENLIAKIFILFIIGFLLIFSIPLEMKNLCRLIGFNLSAIIYFLSLNLWIFFDRTTPKFQYLLHFGKLEFLNTDLIFAVDGISLFFVLLTTLITPILFLVSWYLTTSTRLLVLIILTTEVFTLFTFTALDLFLFFVVFEGLLIPLFISILHWGTGTRKVKAALMLFIYTIISSIFFIFTLFTLYLEIGSTNFFALLNYANTGITLEKQKIIWLALFIAFAIKIPLYPLHTWLPEAHVEAPTFGSVILASLLLKTGGYGLFRFILPIFPNIHIYYTPLIYCLSLLGVIYAALSALRQLDLKRIIAYLSISHMNFCVLGQFSETLDGLIGSLLLMIAHGIIAAGFFISIGILYKRYHERLIFYFSGLARLMPIFALAFFILTLGNMNMPGTSNFIGELLILIGLGQKSLIITILAAIGSAIGALCTIWLWSKIMFGDIKYQYIINIQDLSRKEFFSLLPLLIINFCLGILTNEFIDTFYVSIYFLYTCILL